VYSSTNTLTRITGYLRVYETIIVLDGLHKPNISQVLYSI